MEKLDLTWSSYSMTYILFYVLKIGIQCFYYVKLDFIFRICFRYR